MIAFPENATRLRIEAEDLIAVRRGGKQTNAIVKARRQVARRRIARARFRPAARVTHRPGTFAGQPAIDSLTMAPGVENNTGITWEPARVRQVMPRGTRGGPAFLIFRAVAYLLPPADGPCFGVMTGNGRLSAAARQARHGNMDAAVLNKGSALPRTALAPGRSALELAARRPTARRSRQTRKLAPTSVFAPSAPEGPEEPPRGVRRAGHPPRPG